MRWLHEGIDRLYIAALHRLIPPVFRHGSTSASLPEHLSAVELSMPPVTADGRYIVPARTLAGDVQAGFRLRLGSRAALPVLIFHHGLGEIPHDHTFRWVFPRRMPVNAHLVVVRAPFHRSYVDCCGGLATLSRFMAMCAVSVALIERVRLALAAQGARGSMVAGISLGGFVTLLHHLAYGTADVYAPLQAGPDLAFTMLSTPCRRFLTQGALARGADLQACLDFGDSFRASDTRRVFPLLGRYDVWMPFARYQADYAESGVPVATMDRGHMTGSWAFGTLRAHLLACLRALDAEAPAGTGPARWTA
jgi:hypothetical protein